MGDRRRASNRDRSLTVATVTYRRPEGLADALSTVLREAPSIADLGWTVDVVVVDNDPEGSARAVVDELAPTGRVEGTRVQYHHEPRPGIAAGRNRALEVAERSDALVFIDDDGLPTPGWLRSLVDTYDRYEAVGVVGRMVPLYERPPCEWIESGEFFVRPSRPTGTELPGGPTNNLLLDLGAVRALALRFDEDLGLVGGEDALFTRRLVAEGGRFVWCDEAVVLDRVPDGRMTRRWVLLRRFRVGSGIVLIGLRLADGPVGRARVRLRSIAGIVRESLLGGVGGAVGVVSGSVARRARAAARLAGAVGRLSGLLGLHYREYARPGQPIATRLGPHGTDRAADTVVVLQSFGPPHRETNPYSIQLVDALDAVGGRVRVEYFSWRRALTGRYDVLHLHWPEVKVRGRSGARSVLRGAAFLAVLVRVRLGSSALVRTLHDRVPHEPPNAAQRTVLRLADRWTNRWILLHEETPPPRPGPTVVAPIGEVRSRLLPGDHVDRVPGRLLHFGLVRRYKGVDALLDTFASMEGELTLHVVGRPVDAALEEELTRRVVADGRVTRLAQHVSDARLRREVLEAELVVLPFRSITNSSSAVLALSLGRPVLVPSAPATRALAAEVGEQWVQLYEGRLDAEALAAALHRARALSADALPDLSARSWDRIGAVHADAYRAAAAGER